MPSKNQIKFIRSLASKKNRDLHNVFVAEGEKLVAHFLKKGMHAQMIFATQPLADVADVEHISTSEMKQLTFFSTPSPVFAVFKKPEITDWQSNTKILVLDGVRNPGNLGTIIRQCDWFGINAVWCTPDCADAFNEKVVQASMGSVAAVPVFYFSVDEIIANAKQLGLQLLAADGDGNNLYQTDLNKKSAFILGNEGAGICAELKAACAQTVAIPAASTTAAESLNVAMAAGILLAENFRQLSTQPKK